MTAVFEHSMIARLIAAFVAAWQSSAVGGWFARAGRKLYTAGQNSAAVSWITREGLLNRAWQESLTARLLSAVINIPCAAVKWIYKLCRRVLDGSLAFGAVTGLGRASWLLMGLFALVMLVVPHGQWNNTYALMLAVGITGVFVLGTANSKHKLEVSLLGPYVPFYMAMIFCALATSLSTGMSLRFFGFHLTAFLTALLFVSAIHNDRQLHVTVWLAGLGAAVASVYGCMQGMAGVEVVASQQDMNLNQGMPGRVFSFFDNPNNFAEILVMIVPLLLALFLNSKNIRAKAVAALALIPCVLAIGMTYSRSGWMGLGLAVVIFLALQNWRFIPALLLLGIAAIPFLPESILNRFLTIGNMQDSSARYRVAIYGASERLLGDYWLRGVGLGSDVMKAVFRADYPTLYDGNWPIHTHNNYLQMWGETGIFGLLAYLAMLLGQLKNGIKAWRRTTSREVRNLLCAALGGMGGILLIGFAEYTWFYPRNMFLFWFLFGVIGACVKLSTKDERAEHGRRQAVTKRNHEPRATGE